MDQPAASDHFGSGHLFLADSRLAMALLNYARHRALHRVFGVSREQSNLLTFVLALVAADAAYEGARRAARTPLGLNSAHAVMGGYALRHTALGITGPSGKDVPALGTLMSIAIVGGLAAPGLRHLAGRARASEQRVRRHRIALYEAARRPRAA